VPHVLKLDVQRTGNCAPRHIMAFYTFGSPYRHLVFKSPVRSGFLGPRTRTGTATGPIFLEKPPGPDRTLYNRLPEVFCGSLTGCDRS
jgi:hypothetical protein